MEKSDIFKTSQIYLEGFKALVIWFSDLSIERYTTKVSGRHSQDEILWEVHPVRQDITGIRAFALRTFQIAIVLWNFRNITLFCEKSDGNAASDTKIGLILQMDRIPCRHFYTFHLFRWPLLRCSHQLDTPWCCTSLTKPVAGREFLPEGGSSRAVAQTQINAQNRKWGHRERDVGENGQEGETRWKGRMRH